LLSFLGFYQLFLIKQQPNPSKRQAMNDLNAIQNKNAVNLEMQQAGLTKAKENADKGKLGIKDGMVYLPHLLFLNTSVPLQV
jgi:hypothetical protein